MALRQSVLLVGEHLLQAGRWAPALLSTAQQPLPQALQPSKPSQHLFQHHQQRFLADKPKRTSYFQEQKRKALGLQTPTDSIIQSPDGNPTTADAVMVQPNEGRASLEQVKRVLTHPALIVTRPIEWGTVIFGYEQANRYTVYDQDGVPVAQLMEDYTGLRNELGRQFLRTRRSFTSTVFSADGSQVIFRLRRPMYLINSTMYIEDGDGNTLGEIRQRWHPIRRNYDLYLDKRQFASISGNFLAWEFELKDEKGGTLALLDRNFQGFGKELFTDAGKYVIHFGLPPDKAAQVATTTLEARSGGRLPHPVTPMAVARTDVAVIPTVTGNQLSVVRSLALEERMVVLAAAISIDYDFFSQHSHSSGWLHPPLFMPMPLPGGGAVPAGGGDVPPTVGDASGGTAGTVAGGASAGAADAGVGAFPSASSSPQGSGGPMGGEGGGNDLNLGGDEFHAPPQGGWGAPGGDGEMKWDLPSSSEGGGGGEGAAGGGILAALWELISGGSD